MVNRRQRSSRIQWAWKRVYLSWALSYTMILLLPLVAWIAMQIYTNSIIDSMTHQISSDILATVLAAVDNRMVQIEAMADALATQEQLEAYASGPIASVPLNAYRRYQVIEQMKEYRMRMGDSVQDIYVYDAHADEVLSSLHGYFSAENFHLYRNQRYPKPVETVEEWRGLIRGSETGARFALMGWSDGSQTLCLLKRIPLAAPFATRHFTMTMVIQMHPAWLSRLIQGLSLAEGLGLRIDFLQGQPLLSLPASAEEGERVVHIHTASETGWEYTLSVPEHIYRSGTRNLRLWTPMALAGTVLLGVLLTMYLLRRNYDPLLSVMNMIAARADAPEKEAVSEYEYLSKAFRKLMNEHTLERRKMEAQADRLRNAYMTQLLLDDALKEEQRAEYLPLLGFSEDSGPLVVAVVRERSGQETDPAQVADRMGIGRGEGNAYYGRGIQLRGDAVFLLDCLDMSPEEFREEMEAMRQRLGERYLLAEGGRGAELGGIPAAYAAACQKLRLLCPALENGQASGEAAQEPVRPDSARSARAEAAAAALKEQILSFIDEHYCDPDLSVSRICEHFGNAPSTIFRLFREEGESGLLNQINGRRIDKARAMLLQNGSLAIAHIGKAVGFSSLNTFIRQFKKATGVTPGRFREIAGMVRENRDE